MSLSSDGIYPDIYPWLLPILTELVEHQKESKLAHAWIFYGQSGGGKTALVKRLCKEILAPGDVNKQQWINAHTHPDFKIIEPNEKGNISIDLIRGGIDFLANTPVAASSKILAIFQADKMNAAAQSALLKTLEEPIGHAYLFLTAEKTSLFLPTLLSRCQKQKIGVPQLSVLEAWLSTQALPVSQEVILLAKMLANQDSDLMLFLLSELSKIEEPISPDVFKKSLPLLLYLLSIILSHETDIPGLKTLVESQLGLALPKYVFSPQSIQDRQRKIELYRYVCRLTEKVRIFSGLNTKLLIHSIENFEIS